MLRSASPIGAVAGYARVAGPSSFDHLWPSGVGPLHEPHLATTGDAQRGDEEQQAAAGQDPTGHLAPSGPKQGAGDGGPTGEPANASEAAIDETRPWESTEISFWRMSFEKTSVGPVTSPP